MTRFYDIDAANEALPVVERILLDLRDQRAELIRLRDAVLQTASPDREGQRMRPAGRPAERLGPNTGTDEHSADRPGPGTGAGAAEPAGGDPRLLRLRMQGLIDQMQAGVSQLVERDIQLREIEAGLIDFPALASGRQIWLCWRLGEGEIDWWHELDDGFGGRRRLAELT